jgi:hypothetical protein
MILLEPSENLLVRPTYFNVLNTSKILCTGIQNKNETNAF